MSGGGGRFIRSKIVATIRILVDLAIIRNPPPSRLALVVVFADMVPTLAPRFPLVGSRLDVTGEDVLVLGHFSGERLQRVLPCLWVLRGQAKEMTLLQTVVVLAPFGRSIALRWHGWAKLGEYVAE